jgi:glycosyltransferase involved in cell wall biosynthesis
LKILFICPRLPYPPIKGDIHRTYYQIKELSKKHQITLITYATPDTEPGAYEKLREFCDELIVIKRAQCSIIKNLLHGFFSAMPMQCAYYQSRKMKESIMKTIIPGKYDIIHVQLTRMAPFITQARMRSIKAPVILEFIDTLSMNMEKRLQREMFLLKPFIFYEWSKIKKYEHKLADVFDRGIITSPIDRALLPYPDKVDVLPSGVDLDLFHFSPIARREPMTIIATGNLNYFPNVDAILFFIKKIYPMIKKALPQVELRIVGHSPGAVIKNLGSSEKNIKIIGPVDNMSENLGKAALAVCPMLSGSGIKIKVLESLATGTPTVAMSLAAQAIDVTPGKDIILADEPNGFARVVIDLLQNQKLRESLGLNGRKLIENKYSWPVIVEKLENIYEEAIKNFNKSED